MKIDWGRALWRHHKWYIKCHRNENAHLLLQSTLSIHLQNGLLLCFAANTVKSTKDRSIFGTFIIPSLPFALFACSFFDTHTVLRARCLGSQAILFALDVFNFTIKTHFRRYKSSELNEFCYKYKANTCAPVFFRRF